MPAGTDQLDEWAHTLTECDNLYRELQLITRINPEAYTVNHDAITIMGLSNPDAPPDPHMLHPLAFAKHWAWHLAAETRAIPPITTAWVPLIRYISAHLQHLARADKDDFAHDLRRVRGLLGALVNENRLAQGEADALSALNGHAARKALRAWALTSDRMMKRKDIAKAFPTLTDREWVRLRKRKERSGEDIPAYHYPVKWAAEIAPNDDAPIPAYAINEPYRDAMTDKAWYSLDEMRDQEEAKARKEEDRANWGIY